MSDELEKTFHSLIKALTSIAALKVVFYFMNTMWKVEKIVLTSVVAEGSII